MKKKFLVTFPPKQTNKQTKKHCIGGSDQNLTQEKEIQKRKIMV